MSNKREKARSHKAAANLAGRLRSTAQVGRQWLSNRRLRFVARQNGNFSIVGWTLGQVIGNAGYECAKRRDFAEEKPRYLRA